MQNFGEVVQTAIDASTEEQLTTFNELANKVAAVVLYQLDGDIDKTNTTLEKIVNLVLKEKNIYEMMEFIESMMNSENPLAIIENMPIINQ